MGGDPGRLFLLGHSAGAHLAALVATDSRYLKSVGVAPSILDGVICLDVGFYDIPQRFKMHRQGMHSTATVFGQTEQEWKDASPRYHVAPGKGIPPFLLIHTDREITKIQSEVFARDLKSAGIPAFVYRAAGKNHRSLNVELGTKGDGSTKRVWMFLKKYLNQH